MRAGTDLEALGLSRVFYYACQACATAKALEGRVPRAPRTAELVPEEREAIVR